MQSPHRTLSRILHHNNHNINALKKVNFKPFTTSITHKMAFFPRNYYGGGSEAGFTPLFRLLDDFDNYARQGQGQAQGQYASSNRSAAITFQPKFDVRELKDHFELHGELPGLTKDDVNLEFTDPNTLRIHGRIERTYTAGTPAGVVQDSQKSGAITDSGENHPASKDQQATVEDASEDGTSSAPPQTKTPEEQKDDKKLHKPQKANTSAKFWCTERTVGEFNRSFNFPGQVQQDAVSASLKDGILNIQVPKAPKHEARRIAIQ